MLRVVGLCSLVLVAVAFAADNSQTLSAEDVDQKIVQQYKLNQDEVKLAKDAEATSAQQMVFETALGLSHEKLACKSFKVDPQQIRFTLFSMPSKTISWNGSENPNLIPYFDPELPTLILISGRLQSEEVLQPAKLAFTLGVRGQKMNVISAKWDDYSSCGYLPSVFFITRGVANVVSDMIQNTLVSQNQMNYDQLRLTGFGFGAHIVGLVARKLPQKPARITALDPAGLLFDLLPSSFKLSKGDAKFMDTIMTNRKRYGSNALVGDINFLPNGGQVQNGCEKCSCIPYDCKNECSHTRAIAYYLESAQFGSAGFVAKPANTWADFLAKKSFVNHTEIMGEGVSQMNTGTYYLITNAQAPFSRGINGAYLFSEVGLNENQNENQASNQQ